MGAWVGGKPQKKTKGGGGFTEQKLETDLTGNRPLRCGKNSQKTSRHRQPKEKVQGERGGMIPYQRTPSTQQAFPSKEGPFFAPPAP